MKQAIFLATLMYSSTTVFGMQGEKSSFSDQSNNSFSKVRLMEVIPQESQQLLDSQTLEEKWETSKKDLERAIKDVASCALLYDGAVKRVKAADESNKSAISMFGRDNPYSLRMLEDKRRAEEDSKTFLEMLKQAESRRDSAEKYVNCLARQLSDLSVSENSGQKSKKDIDADRMSNGTSFEEPFVRLREYCLKKGIDLRWTNREIEIDDVVYKIDKGSHSSLREARNAVADYALKKLIEGAESVQGIRYPVKMLSQYLLCQKPSYKLNFEYETLPEGKYNCVLKIQDDVYKIDDGNFNSQKEAKNAVAEYALKELTEKNASVQDASKSPVAMLYEYCIGKSNKLRLKDLKFECEILPRGKFNYVITIYSHIPLYNGVYKMDGKSFNRREEAKNAAAEYVYNLLVEKAKNGEALSSEVNHQE